MKAARVCTFPLICVTMILALLSTMGHAQNTLKARAVEIQTPHALRIIRYANGRLTVRVQDVSLRELLQEIARQSGLTLVGYGSLNKRMTLEFHRLSLTEGLRRILRHRSFVVEYAQPTLKERPPIEPQVKTLWVLSKEGEESPVPITVVAGTKARSSSPAVATGISRLQAGLSSQNAAEREEAVGALGESGRPEAVALLTSALADENENVREAAIVALAEIGGAAAAQALAIALRDEDPWLRVEAIETLGEIGGESAIGVLEQALNDEDESIREAAADMMAQLRNQAQ